MKTKKKAKKGAWFVETRWSYLPCSLPGALTYIPYIAFLIFSLYAVGQYTNSAAGALFDVFPYWVCATVVMHWIAGHTS